MFEVSGAAVRATHDFLSEADIQYFKARLFEFFEGVELVGIRDRLGMVNGFVGVAQDQVEMLFVHPSCHGMGRGRTLEIGSLPMGCVLVRAIGFKLVSNL